MGKLGRFACILTPMLLTLASLTCTVLLMAGGTNKKIGWVNDLYIFRIDTRNLQTQDTLDLLPTDLDDVDTGLPEKTSDDLGLADFYNAYLWNYCSGEQTMDGSKEVWKVTECSKPKATFYFNIIDIFAVDSEKNDKEPIDEDDLPDAVRKVNKAIKVLSNVMIAMFCCGLVATVVTFIVGWFGLLSRWGSCVTTIFADVAFSFLLAGSVIATGLYATLREGFNRALKDFGAKASLNPQLLVIMWLAVAFALAGAVFWMFSTCCCSGRSRKIMGQTERSRKSYEKAPYTYERVASPYAPTTQVPSGGMQPAVGYEPYRHAGAQ
ncbi:SUR7/PalI family-domain-containing protein [Kalaharituber pfeilii]|nr:SUR7/PalI family-domain-containing protein [Kalaharituber pfeilii]